MPKTLPQSSSDTLAEYTGQQQLQYYTRTATQSIENEGKQFAATVILRRRRFYNDQRNRVVTAQSLVRSDVTASFDLFLLPATLNALFPPNSISPMSQCTTVVFDSSDCPVSLSSSRRFFQSFNFQNTFFAGYFGPLRVFVGRRGQRLPTKLGI